MTVTDLAKEKLIELIDNELTNGELGTSSQAPSSTDTALISEVTSTIEVVNGTPNAKQLVITYNIDSLTGNGNTFTEYGNFFTTSETLFNRVTFTGVPKNSAIEFQVTTILNIP
jgi:hypothetical protein